MVLVSVVAADVGAEGCSFAVGTKFSTSFFTIRPPSAEPFASFKLMPLSFAILRAKGDALTRESSDASEEVEVDAGASSFDCDFSCLGSSDLEALVEEPDFCLSNGVTSVPSGPTIAIISFTFAACPASTPTYNNVPSA